ncbi:MAG: glycosyltransferase family 2 protein [Ilumatobacter sp.]|nr:glycosyltransferase family 2 protein [Ilumatobacter sp.]
MIVCAYTTERYDDLVACLDGLRRQSRPADEIVCVIDGNDELRKRIEHLVQHDGVTVVANRYTAGLSGARNTGIDATTADIVAFIDDDAVPADTWLAEIVAPFGTPTVAATGGRIEPGWSDRRPGWFPPHLDWAVGCTIPTMPADGGAIRNMYGASAAFRRDALVAVGGFPTELGRVGADAAGCEETDVCIRIRQRDPDATIVYAPRSEVVHRVTPERSTVKYVLVRCFAEGRSKAVLSRRVGAAHATSDERAYAVGIVAVILRDLIGGLARPARIGRAAVLSAGLASASLGFAAERLRRRGRAAA